MIVNINVGDLLYRPKGIVDHVGVYLGYGRVIHNTPSGGVEEITFSEFANGYPVRVKKCSLSGLSGRELRRRAFDVLSKEYDLLSHNCEDFAENLTGDPPSCKQMTGAIVGGGLAFCCAKNQSNATAAVVTILGAVLGATIVNQARRYDAVVRSI